MELFKLFGKIAVENSEANKGIDETTGKAEKSHSKMATAFGNIGKAGLAVGKTIAKGLADGAGAAVALGKTALDTYGEYEQLVGGVETLFKGSAKQVMQYANNAYKTAGMSANEYVTTVTSFSASLLQSLDGDTAKAAEKANVAITDMSDNANKMGTDIASIQNAYQGFAKQNYTMLDNLKLGYGGTKEEMQRLLKDAEKLSGVKYDISSYSDIVDAIHIVQTEMGITGTTAKEASSTIQGSFSAAKGAWTNLLGGLADESQDFDVLLSNFIDSVVTVIDNILPRVAIIAQKIPDLITGIVSKLPALLKGVLPSLVSAATTLIKGLVDALPSILSALMEVLPLLLNGLSQIVDALLAAFPQIIDMLIKFLVDPNNIQSILQAAIKLMTAIPLAISQALPTIIAAAPDIIWGIIQGLFAALPDLLGSLDQILENMLNAFLTFFGIHSPSTLMIEKAKYIVDGIIQGIKDLPQKAAEFFQKMKDKVVSIVEGIKSNVVNKVNELKSGFISKIDSLRQSVQAKFDEIRAKITAPIETAKNKVKSIVDQIKSFFSGMSLSLPKIKLPHFKISGKLSLDPPSVPKLAIEWYRNGGIMEQPTLFGFNQATGRAMVGGEAGAEAITPISVLLDYVKTAVREENAALNYQIDKLMIMLERYLTAILENSAKDIYLSSGELVGALGREIDDELGNISRLKGRGI